MNGLIGYTGFVGGNLDLQVEFDKKYNSRNIRSIAGESFDILVCAGAPGTKWLANAFPEKDRLAIDTLMASLSQVRAKLLVLISTIDVYKEPRGKDEDDLIDTNSLHAYGLHRFLLEQFVADNFLQHSIIRLPALFGKGLKKNVIYDFLHDNNLEKIHAGSMFQFYDLDHLWQDINKAAENGISLLNVSTQPVSVQEIAKEVFSRDFANHDAPGPVHYDIRSKFVDIFRPGRTYMYDKKEIFSGLKKFVVNSKYGKKMA